MENEAAQHDIWRMFDRIAPSYDLVNRILSLGIDRGWRKKLVKMAKPAKIGQKQKILDVATGTGDLAVEFARSNPPANSITAVDMSTEMLYLAGQKIGRKNKNLHHLIKLLPADATSLPFREKSFHIVSIAFGIRNVVAYTRALREFHRVLQVGGRAFILEFSLPAAIIRAPYLFYFRHVLPRLAGWISGDRGAYHYLNETVENFPYGEDFLQIMRDAGFSETRQRRLSFGIATIYEGVKK